MIRKSLCALFAAAVMLLAAPAARAAQTGGSIQIGLNVGDLAVTNGAFTIYQVGIPITDGYRITEDFGGGFVRQEDALSPHLAQWLSEAQGEQGRTLLLDADGRATFSQLGEGLYLVIQSELTDGFYPIQPFLLAMPSGDRWEIPVNLDPLPRMMPSPETADENLASLGLLGMALSLTGLLACAGVQQKKRLQG